MTEITLYNTAKRAKQVLAPIDPDNVRMYVCGPTVYDRAHLGNARPAIVFDVLYRLLRHVYGPEHVTYVRNFTDVDDKINDTALARQQAGAQGTLVELIAQRTEETIDWYHDDMDAVGVLRPDMEPRATGFIEEMKEMIAELIEKDFAYAVPATIGHNSRAQYVYLDSDRVPSHAFLSVDGFEDAFGLGSYGYLSGRSLEDMVSGSRGEVGEGKRNPLDSVLWKPSTIEQPGWESDWGYGRPGWHIECSAMSRKLLGKRFDIHGGGLDLLFPHHENERAQCIACDGEDASANIWMHNEMLQVEGKKMSKSLGNFFTVRDLLDQGVPGEVIRFVMLSTHYRKPMDWTEKKRAEAEATLQKWHRFVVGVEPTDLPHGFVESLCDDLNTPGAIAWLHSAFAGGDHAGLSAGLKLLGLERTADSGWTGAPAISTPLDESDRDLVAELVFKRHQAKLNKNYSEADALRSALSDAGVVLHDRKDAPATWEITTEFDPSKLEALK